MNLDYSDDRHFWPYCEIMHLSLKRLKHIKVIQDTWAPD